MIARRATEIRRGCGFPCHYRLPGAQGARHADRSGEPVLALAQQCGGKATTFEEFVCRHQPALLRRARALVSNDALSQDVVQETWLAVVNGIHRFEGRSSLRTWVFRILENRARTILHRERRGISLSPERIATVENRRAREDPEALMVARETLARVLKAIMALPSRHRRVLGLHLFRGYSAASLSRALNVTEGNQRVLLHRARMGVKNAIRSGRVE